MPLNKKQKAIIRQNEEGEFETPEEFENALNAAESKQGSSEAAAGGAPPNQVARLQANFAALLSKQQRGEKPLALSQLPAVRDEVTRRYQANPECFLEMGTAQEVFASVIEEIDEVAQKDGMSVFSQAKAADGKDAASADKKPPESKEAADKGKAADDAATPEDKKAPDELAESLKAENGDKVTGSSPQPQSSNGSDAKAAKLIKDVVAQPPGSDNFKTRSPVMTEAELQIILDNPGILEMDTPEPLSPDPR